MLAFAPRTDSRLVTAAERLDSPWTPIAETNRRIGAVAAELGLFRPSYEQIRRVVQRAREQGRYPSAGEVLLKIAFRSRPPTALIDQLTKSLPP